MAEFTFAECEDMVEAAVKQPDSPQEALAALMTTGDLPPYIEGLRQLRAGLAQIKITFTPCGCGDPACIDKPAHRDHLNETIHPPHLVVEKAIEELQQETVHFVYRMLNCECPGCSLKEKIHAAKYN